MITGEIIIFLLTSVIVLWKTVSSMIDRKRVAAFLPFLIIGILMLFRASFVFYELFDVLVWSILKYLNIILMAWILIYLTRREKYGAG